jgi:hypothetical protein
MQGSLLQTIAKLKTQSTRHVYCFKMFPMHMKMLFRDVLDGNKKQVNNGVACGALV